MPINPENNSIPILISIWGEGRQALDGVYSSRSKEGSTEGGKEK